MKRFLFLFAIATVVSANAVVNSKTLVESVQSAGKAYRCQKVATHLATDELI